MLERTKVSIAVVERPLILDQDRRDICAIVEGYYNSMGVEVISVEWFSWPNLIRAIITYRH